VTHWQDVRAILHAEYERRQLPLVTKHLNNFLGAKNIGVLQGREWKVHRAAIVRSFSPAALAKSKGAMIEVTRTLVKSLRERIPVGGAAEYEVETLMKMITVDVFGLAAFSHRFECCENLTSSPVARSFDFLGKDMARRLDTKPFSLANFFYSVPTRDNLRHSREEGVLRSFLTNAVRERRSAVEPKQDLLSNLLEAHAGAKELLATDEDTLSDIMMSLLFAGYDTTSITLTYALYLLSQHALVESRCMDEINSVSSFESLDDLGYCRGVLYETLRLFPPAPATYRTLQKSIELRGGIVITAGTNVFVPIWWVHRSEQNFCRPNEFCPERWVEQEKGSSRWVERQQTSTKDDGIPAANPSAFFAFSAGARSCAAQNFALSEAILVLAGLLKELKFTALPDYTLHPVRDGLVQHPDDGMPMQITIRGGASAKV
jgi:cytochrome P450